MTATLQRLLDEVERLPDVSAPEGLCLDVRGPFRVSMTFATRDGTTSQEGVAAAASGIEVPVPQPEAPEKVSADDATLCLHALLARHAAPGVTGDDVGRLAQAMVHSVTDPSAAAMLEHARIPPGGGEGLILLGSLHTWAVWLHSDPLRPFLRQRAGTA